MEKYKRKVEWERSGQTHLNSNTRRTLHDDVHLFPIFKQSVGFQEKYAVATLHRNQMHLPCGNVVSMLTRQIFSNTFPSSFLISTITRVLQAQYVSKS